MQIYLDMDGVLVDMVQGILDWYQIDKVDWPKGEYNLNKILGFDVFKDLPWQFWANLHCTKHGKALLRYVDDPIILTQPTDIECVKGKEIWLEGNGLLLNSHITTNKALYANFEAVLIDDYLVNCLNFFKAGGQAICWPTVHNNLHSYAHDPLEHVLKQIHILRDSQYDYDT